MIRKMDMELKNETNLITAIHITSECLDWLDKDSRINDLVFIYSLSGSASVRVNALEHELNTLEIMTLLPKNMVCIESCTSDFSAHVMLVSWENMGEINLTKSILSITPAIKESPIVLLTESEREFVSDFCMLLSKLYVTDTYWPKHDMIRNMLITFLYGIVIAYNRHNSTSELDEKKHSHKEILFRDLIKLIIKYYQRERSLHFYANLLHVSPKYLGACIKEVSGELLSNIIAEFVLEDAKTQLLTTDNTIQQISDSLNFPDASSFGKYFKKNCGLSPKQFKERN